jgi:hypothetical protein
MLMTNQEKFVEVFGKDMLNKIAADVKDVHILRWFFCEYGTTRVEDGVITITYDNKPKPTTVEEIVREAFSDAAEKVTEEQPVVKKRRYKNGIRHYNTAWYEEVVEDFYCSSERLKTLKVDDDKTPVKCKSLDSLKNRLNSAIKDLGIDDCVQVHKYYSGTCNDCLTKCQNCLCFSNLGGGVSFLILSPFLLQINPQSGLKIILYNVKCVM